MLAPVLLAAALAGVYLAWAPPSADLAAQTFRSDIFAAHGFAIWNNDWYGGHYLPGYSVLFPPLGAALGPRLAGAAATVAAAALFAAIAVRGYGERGRLGTFWFAAATATLLLTGRLTFALGIAVGLGALLAAQRHRPALAATLALVCALASPVAALFLALAGCALALAGERDGGLALAAGALAGIAALTLAFPSAGREPFVASAFWAVPGAAAILLWLLPLEERTLRLGTWLYLLLCIVLFLVDTPVGGNATRLGALFAGPLLALPLAGRRNVALVLAAVPLLYWQWQAPVRDVADALGDPSVHRSYYAPLLAELERLTADPAPAEVRVEIPPTHDRWEATYVAPSFPLARGWLRQDESDDLDLFTGDRLTASAYRAWLDGRGVSYVALPDVHLDYLADDEAALIRSGLPYLDRVWSSSDWRLYAVAGSPGLVSGPPARVAAVEPDTFTLAASRPGSYLVRFHWTRYWTVTRGDACVQPAGDWTRIEAREPGMIEVGVRFSLGRLLGSGGRCSG